MLGVLLGRALHQLENALGGHAAFMGFVGIDGFHAHRQISGSRRV
jgi:hypothetical protein